MNGYLLVQIKIPTYLLESDWKAIHLTVTKVLYIYKDAVTGKTVLTAVDCKGQYCLKSAYQKGRVISLKRKFSEGRKMQLLCNTYNTSISLKAGTFIMHTIQIQLHNTSWLISTGVSPLYYLYSWTLINPTSKEELFQSKFYRKLILSNSN